MRLAVDHKMKKQRVRMAEGSGGMFWLNGSYKGY